MKKNINKFNFIFSVENVTKIVSVIVAVGGLIFAVYKFQIEQYQTEESEYRKKLIDNRTESYKKFIDISAKLVVNRNDSTKLESLIREFDYLYLSDLRIDKNTKVEKKLRDFKMAIREYKTNKNNEDKLKKTCIELRNELSYSLKKTPTID